MASDGQNNIQKKKPVKRALIIAVSAIGALILLVGAFFGGYFTKGALGDTSYDWVLSVIQNYYYEELDLTDADETAIDALVEYYLDDYSEYYTAEEYAALVSQNSGNRSGLGITYTFISGQGVLINSVMGNSPAYLAGVRSGDVLVSGSVGGQETAFTSSTVFSSFVSSLEEGESAAFYTSDGGEYVIAKSAYVISYVTFATNQSGWYFAGDEALTLTQNTADAIEYLPEGVGYICLTQFYGSAVQQFKMAVEQLNEEGVTSVILDLRNDGGGYTSVMAGIAGCFEECAGKTAMIEQYRSGKTETLSASSYADKYTLSSDIKVYVLANSSTASASEALIGALISWGVCDYGDIYISEYGEDYLTAINSTAEAAKSGKTYGKGIMQTTYLNLETGEALKLTTAYIYWPDGKTCIHGTGLSSAMGCNTVAAPAPQNGDGDELAAAVAAIFGLTS